MANDGYAGAVSPGGPSDVRELPRLTIRKCSVSSIDNNAYLLTCRSTGAQLLVDAADDAGPPPRPARGGRRAARRHRDDPPAPGPRRRPAGDGEATGARTAAGVEDADALPVAVDDRLSHGDTVTFGDVTLDVVALRGHTPGSVALAYRDPSDPTASRTSSPVTRCSPVASATPRTRARASSRSTATSPSAVFDVYDDDTWVYPGHGDDTTLGAERPHLDEWRARGW